MNNKIISCAVMRNFLHIGHYNLVSEMLKNSDKVYIIFGSAQAHSDIRNPFTIKQRIDLVRLAFGKSSKIKIISIKDINAVTKEEWESYVLEKIKSEGLETPTDYWGGSQDDVSWYGNVKTENNKFLKINILNRYNSSIMSGTLVRQSISNNGVEWKEHVPKCMIEYIENNFPKHLMLSNILNEREKLIQNLVINFNKDINSLKKLTLKELRAIQ